MSSSNGCNGCNDGCLDESIQLQEGPQGPAGTNGRDGDVGETGPEGPSGTTIIDTDVRDITTSQTSFSAANLTVTIPANSFETIDDTVQFEGYFISDTWDAISGVQLVFAGTTVDIGYLAGTSSEVIFGNGGYQGIHLVTKLVMSASGSITPISKIDIFRNGISSYSVPTAIGNSLFNSVLCKGDEITGLTFTNSNNLVIKMKTSSGEIKMFFSQVTLFKK